MPRIIVTLLLIAAVPACCQQDWRSAARDAEAMRLQGRLADAERVLRSILDEVRRLEPDFAPAATVYHNLGGVYQDMGRCDPAVEAYQRSLELWEKAGDAGAKYLMPTANHLVGLYLECGDLRGAEQHYRTLVAPRIAGRGSDERNPDVAQAIGNLGSIEFQKRRFKEARACYEEAFAILERASPEPSREMGILLNNIAFAFLHTGEAARGLESSGRGIAMLEATTAPSDPVRISALANQANLYAIAHRPAEAEPLFVRALESARHILGEAHPVTAAIMARYAALLRSSHRKQEAAALETRAREIQRSFQSTGRSTVDVRELGRVH
jgi:tetratricopeptide (TPR) repeat protein